MISRTMKGIEDVSGLRFPTTPLAIAATAGAAGSALAGFPTRANHRRRWFRNGVCSNDP